jgi:hypothetical protein
MQNAVSVRQGGLRRVTLLEGARIRLRAMEGFYLHPV